MKLLKAIKEFFKSFCIKSIESAQQFKRECKFIDEISNNQLCKGRKQKTS